jgi:hypothetical protein
MSHKFIGFDPFFTLTQDTHSYLPICLSGYLWVTQPKLIPADMLSLRPPFPGQAQPPGLVFLPWSGPSEYGGRSPQYTPRVFLESIL